MARQRSRPTRRGVRPQPGGSCSRRGRAVTARHVVGIDLGTTHCAVAVAPLGGDGVASPDVLAIPQLAERAALEARPLLPSFLYFAHESEGAQALPWDAERTLVVGEYARSRGLDAPLRVIASA